MTCVLILTCSSFLIKKKEKMEEEEGEEKEGREKRRRRSHRNPANEDEGHKGAQITDQY